MNSAATSTASRIRQWAAGHLADYDARKPGTIFAKGVVLDVAQGYELQAAVADLRRDRGERLIGYKVGCTSPRIKDQLGIDHCVSGRLYETEQHTPGVELSRQNFANLAIEGELAIELSHEPSDESFSDTGIPACIARVFPVIELHHHIFRGDQPSAGELIANNALHAGFIAGSGVSIADIVGEPSPNSSSLSIFANDRLLEECSGPSLVQTIRSSLRWLTAVVHERGEQLRAGQIILTGSIPKLIAVTEDCGIRVEAPPFGNVHVQFIP
jgi:2-keto-4-pentenoate hydratase